MQWEVLLQNVDIQGFYTSYWKEIVLPIEGYQEIASLFGKFMERIEKVKRNEFDTQELKFDDQVMYGDLEDLCMPPA